MGYSGKEPCVGCGTSGADRMRREKNCLCYDCEATMKKGRAAEKEAGMDYVGFRLYFNALQSFFGDNSFNAAVRDVLRFLDNPFAETSAPSSTELPFGRARESSASSSYYHIPKELVNPIKDVFTSINNVITEAKKLREDADKYYQDRKARAERLAQETIEGERDKVFMEGVERGRDLLAQLNAGEITLNEFESPQERA